MADPRYDIYFRGEILAGEDAAQVKAAVAKIFKANDAKLDLLFSGKVNTIKKSVDKATAAKYQQAFKKAGAKAVITLAKVASSPEAPQPKVTAESKSVVERPPVTEGSWDILPTGSDLLKPDERRNIPDVEVDTSAIKILSPFSEIEVAEKDVPEAPDTTHISVASVGEDMNPERVAPVADLDLDLSAFSIAEAGVILVDKKEEVVPPAPDTNHIKLV